MQGNTHLQCLLLPFFVAKNLVARQTRHGLSLYLMGLPFLFSFDTIRCHALSFAVRCADFHWSNQTTLKLNRGHNPRFFPWDVLIMNQKHHFAPAALYGSDTNTYPIV